MAAQDRTTVFEMRDRADIPYADQLITPSSVGRHPVRDIDELRSALHNASSLWDAARDLGCAKTDVVHWADVYNLTELLPDHRPTEE